MTRLFLIFSTLAFTGCPAHIAIPKAPRPFHSLETKVAYYDEWGVGRQDFTTVVSTYENGLNSVSTHQTLVLANGMTVHYPEDLLPALAENSPAHQAIFAYKRAKKKGSMFLGAGSALAVISIPIMMMSDFGTNTGLAPLLVGTAVMSVGAGAIAYGMILPIQPGADVVNMYDKSLLQTLGLKRRGSDAASRFE